MRRSQRVRGGVRERERDKITKRKKVAKKLRRHIKKLAGCACGARRIREYSNDERHLKCARLSMICLVVLSRMLNIKRELFVRNSTFFCYFTELPKKK